MEVRVEVTTENPFLGQPKVTNTAYLVYVAIDGQGRPAPVPPLLFETDEESARAVQAQQRQAYRKQNRESG